MNKLMKVMLSASIFIPGIVGAEENKQMQIITHRLPAPASQFSDGKRQIGLDTYKGKYVLVNFWATWCSPCLTEMPSLDRLAARFEKKGVVVVAISQDEGGPAQVRPFVERLKLSKIRVLFDPEKRGFRDYALRGLPTTFLLSPQSNVIARLEGSAIWDERELANQVENLIKAEKN